jgi:hypothetical protein
MDHMDGLAAVAALTAACHQLTPTVVKVNVYARF